MEDLILRANDIKEAVANIVEWAKKLAKIILEEQMQIYHGKEQIKNYKKVNIGSKFVKNN